jgi:hypothetical protein
MTDESSSKGQGVMSEETSAMLYYLDDFADEIMPCEWTLESWAAWLSKPDLAWHRPEPAKDGQQFACTAQREMPDIIATRCGVDWSFSREVNEGCTLMAVRYGEGLGWAADNIIWGEDMMAALRESFTENDAFCEDVEFVAIALCAPKMIATYHAAPAPRLVVSTVQ